VAFFGVLFWLLLSSSVEEGDPPVPVVAAVVSFDGLASFSGRDDGARVEKSICRLTVGFPNAVHDVIVDESRAWDILGGIDGEVCRLMLGRTDGG
jgi:hypothetical protein